MSPRGPPPGRNYSPHLHAVEVVGQILLPHQEAEGRIQEACHRDLAQAVEITEGKGQGFIQGIKISYFFV